MRFRLAWSASGRRRARGQARASKRASRERDWRRTVVDLLGEVGKVVVGDGGEFGRVDGKEDGGIGCGPLDELREAASASVLQLALARTFRTEREEDARSRVRHHLRRSCS